MPEEFENSSARMEEDERELLAEMSAEEIADLSSFGESRRQFLLQMSAASAALIAAQMLNEREVFGAPLNGDSIAGAISPEASASVKLRVNGAEKTLTLDSRVTLLDALREKMQLTGTKKGCDHGQCGACTVLVNGRRTLSCLTLAAMSDGQDITTIEGLAKGDELHPMQAAFVKHDGFQCGYCTPGQICSAVALLQEAKNGEASYVTANLQANARNIQLSDEEIKERMSGNICRCGAYPNIVAAIREVHTGKSTEPV